MAPQATRNRIYGSKALGNREALAGRLRAARQRAAALLVASLREAERDASFGSWEAPAVTAERELVGEALSALLTRPENPADRAAQAELERTEALHQLGQQLLSREERLDLLLEAEAPRGLPVVLTP